MPLLEQIDVMRAYMRTLCADMNRAYREEGAHYRKRRVCPFVQSLRYRRISNAFELEDVAEECLNQLRDARALSIADFFPGEQIVVEVVLKDHERQPERHVIKDVEWSKPDTYHYVAWQLTKDGQLFKRGPSWLCPSKAIRITRCTDSLPEDTLRECAHFWDSAREFIDDVRDRGKIDDIVKYIRERRERRGY